MDCEVLISAANFEKEKKSAPNGGEHVNYPSNVLATCTVLKIGEYHLGIPQAILSALVLCQFAWAHLFFFLIKHERSGRS